MALSILILSGTPAVGQATGPVFDADVEARLIQATGETQLTLHTRISYGSLSFLSLPEGFSAEYETTVNVFHADDRGRPRDLVLSRLFSRQVPPLVDFSTTLADTLYNFAQELVGSIESGMYVVSVSIEDANTRLASSRDVIVEVPDFDSDVSLSTILLLEQTDGTGPLIRPSVANVFDVKKRNFFVSFDVYARVYLPVRFSYDIYRLMGHGRKTQREELPARSFAPVDARTLRRGTNQVRSNIPMNDLRPGSYMLSVTVEDAEGNALVAAWKSLEIRWMGLLEQVSNLDAAIAQLEPIAKRRQLEAMQEAPTRQERYALFKAFWDKRDPTPRTERNERMEKYYYRVWYADERFASIGLNGWQSDRGNVFLRFGEPDRREAHPINARESFEVWTYSSINRRFIFIDRDGNGIFELFRPIWDERNRIR